VGGCVLHIYSSSGCGYPLQAPARHKPSAIGGFPLLSASHWAKGKLWGRRCKKTLVRDRNSAASKNQIVQQGKNLNYHLVGHLN
jgi:hypothetical protein